MPLVERWSWNINNTSWVPLDTPLQGIGDLTAAPTGSPNSTSWWPSCLPSPPTRGIFAGNERYYGTATLMLDGQVLISGGSWFLNQESGPSTVAAGFLPGNNSNNVSVELYDPIEDTGRGTSTVLSSDPGSGLSAPTTSPQEIFNPDFTHVFVLPNPATPSDAHAGHGYGILVLGSPGIPFGFDLDMPDWYRQEATVPPVAGWPRRPNAPTTPASYALMVNDGSTSVLLPLRMSVNGSGVNDWGYHNGAIMYAGGFKNSGNPEPDISDQIDAFDPYGDPTVPGSNVGTWYASANPALSTPRHHPSAVLLPDGTIAIVGGHDSPTSPGGQNKPAQLHAEYVDPRNGLTRTTGATAMQQYRAYHGVALLLPDGRVFFGGGRRGGPVNVQFLERADYNILSPWYVSQPRPSINSVQYDFLSRQNHPVPGDPPHSTLLVVDMPSSSPPAEAVMISLGSMTHSYDSNQRSVQVAMTEVLQTVGVPNRYTLRIWAPAYQWAPPGYYMLFILDQQPQGMVPSPAAIIRLR